MPLIKSREINNRIVKAITKPNLKALNKLISEGVDLKVYAKEGGRNFQDTVLSALVLYVYSKQFSLGSNRLDRYLEMLMFLRKQLETPKFSADTKRRQELLTKLSLLPSRLTPFVLTLLRTLCGETQNIAPLIPREPDEGLISNSFGLDLVGNFFHHDHVTIRFSESSILLARRFNRYLFDMSVERRNSFIAAFQKTQFLKNLDRAVNWSHVNKGGFYCFLYNHPLMALKMLYVLNLTEILPDINTIDLQSLKQKIDEASHQSLYKKKAIAKLDDYIRCSTNPDALNITIIPPDGGSCTAQSVALARLYYARYDLIEIKARMIAEVTLMNREVLKSDIRRRLAVDMLNPIYQDATPRLKDFKVEHYQSNITSEANRVVEQLQVASREHGMIELTVRGRAERGIAGNHSMSLVYQDGEYLLHDPNQPHSTVWESYSSTKSSLSRVITDERWLVTRFQPYYSLLGMDAAPEEVIVPSRVHNSP